MQGTITSHLAFGDNFLNSLHEATLLSPTVPLLTTNKRFISKYWPSHAILCRKKFSGCPWFLKSRLLNKMNKPLILSSQVSFPASSYSMFPLTLSELQPHGPFSSSNVSYWPPLWAFAHCPIRLSFFPDHSLHICQATHPNHLSSGKTFLKWLCNLISKPGYFWELECYQKLSWITGWDPHMKCVHSSSYRYIALYLKGWKSKGGGEH